MWLHNVYPDFATAFRFVSFNLVSIATSCGLVNADYGHWPVFAPMWMLFLSCVCASSGSTGGGIKVFRVLVLVKQSLREMFALVHPQAVAPLKIAGQLVSNRVVFSVLAFIFLYFITIVVLTFALSDLGARFHLLGQRHRRQHQQRGAGAERGGTWHHLRHAQRLPAVDVHGGDVPRTRGDLHGADPVHADLLAQMMYARCPE